MQLIKEQKLTPKSEFVKSPFPIYKITAKFKDFQEARKRLYYIKYTYLTIDTTAKFISKSSRELKDQICQPKWLNLIRDNFQVCHLPYGKYKDGQKVHIYLEGPKEGLTSKAVLFYGQYMGEILRDEVLDEEFVVKEFVHEGAHVYWQIVRTKEDELYFYSYLTKSQIEKLMKDTPVPKDNLIRGGDANEEFEEVE